MKKFSSLLVALMLVVGVFGAVSASAQTAAELQALVNQLLAQISALQGGAAAPAAGGAAITSDLTVGSKGADVTTLQNFLISKSFLTMPAGVAQGYFGTLTKNALAAFQAANGITPAAGYFGAKTRAVVNPMLAPVVTVPGTTVPGTTPTTPSVTLSGTDGSIAGVTKLSQYSNEEVGEGQKDVKIAGIEVEATNDGDIALKSMKVSFNGTANTSTASKKLADYVASVSIWQGATKVATVNAADFNKDSTGIYSKIVTLNSGVVVKSDTKEKFYITVDAQNTLDSTDINNDAWTVDVDNIRFEDGSGVITTDTTSNGKLDVPINFTSFSTAANTEFKISTDSTNPEADTVAVDDVNNTDNVTLLIGKIQIKGTSDVTLNELPITLTTGSSTQSVSAIANSLTLKIGDNEWSESVASSTNAGTTTFTDLDYTIAAGKTVTFTITADINDIQTGAQGAAFYEGDSLTASLSSINRGYVDVENSEGDQLASGDKTGSATGNAQTFRVSGINVGNLKTSSATELTNVSDDNTDNQGKYIVTFDVTAFEDTAWVALNAASSTSGTLANGINFNMEDSTGALAENGTTSATVRRVSGGTSESGFAKIEAGETVTLEMTVYYDTTATGNYHVQLNGVNFNQSSATTADQTVAPAPASDFESADVQVHN